MDKEILVAFVNGVPLLIAAIVTTGATIYAAFLQRKNHQLENKLNDYKKQTFVDFLDTLVGSMQLNDNRKLNKLEKEMLKFKKSVLLYGSAETVKSVNKWMLESSENNTATIFDNIEKILRELRNDVGLSNKGLKKYELIQLFVRDQIKSSLPNKNKK